MRVSVDATAWIWFRRLLRVRRPLIVSVDVALIVASYVLAYGLRGDFSLPESWRPGLLRSLPFLLVTRLLAFHRYGLFEGWSRYTGMNDFLDIVKAVAVSSAFFVTATVLALGVYSVPRSVVLIDGMLLIGLLSASRFASRLFWTRSIEQARGDTQRAVIVGDLPSAEPLVRELLEEREIPLRPVGLVALNGDHAGGRLHGIPVLGREEDLTEILSVTPADVVLLAVSSRQAATLRRVLAKCTRQGVAFKLVPPLREMIAERPRLESVRNLRVEDLLGRAEVYRNVAGLREMLSGRRVLITGAGGSIGSHLAREVATSDPEEIIFVDRNEKALAMLDAELRRRAAPPRILSMLCDIRHRRRMVEIFGERRPHVVYHAAAYKHVPMMELNPIEAVKNNVLGTRDVLEVAEDFAVEKFVLISTDKAVKPVNIMGRTKRVAERFVEGATGGSCRKIAVRFGNVFGSEGSVVPILLRQIREGGPVTVTHAEATRFFMTIREAAQLVLEATVLGQGGEIFVLDMAEPIRILDLATSLIRLAGLEPGREIEIRFTGLRPGERLHEERLVDPTAISTPNEKIWVRRAAGNPRELGGEIETVERLIAENDQGSVLEWLRRMSDGKAEARALA